MFKTLINAIIKSVAVVKDDKTPELENLQLGHLHGRPGTFPDVLGYFNIGRQGL